ncbi:hypothetical protein Ahy_A04g018030 [Arachis hypogaea]|uniref:Aminotransferase-like plant mobile domain-containing protein n=1 Tax=Arachis hypogaea TaxID=3818 RepID=A0A445DCR7_ARAHY|nr:hypothetical protein Ahy_A04g018030 [Arachis hypogaea]
MGDDPGRLYRLDGVAHIAGVINDEVSGFCKWYMFSGFCCYYMLMETFGECPEGADEATVRRFARAYIMMLLGTQLLADKSGNRIHIRWLPYVARLEEIGGYSWGSAALAWLYRCMCRVANRHFVKLAGPLQLLQSWIFWQFPKFRPNGYDLFSWPLASRWSGYNPGVSEKGRQVQMTRLRIDMLQPKDFIWMPYSTPDVVQVVHPEVLEPRHTALWRSVTSLIYFAVVEWHQVDRVLPQFGGVQACPRPALNIDFLMSKDSRGGDRWFPHHLQHWHLHWETHADHVLRFDVVADPGPLHDFLEWWRQHEKRFLSPEMYLRDPRDIPFPVEATQRVSVEFPTWTESMTYLIGVGLTGELVLGHDVATGSGGGWTRLWRMVTMQVGVVVDEEVVGGRRRGPADHHVGGDPRDNAVPGGAAQGVVIPDAGGVGGEWYGSGLGDPSAPVDAGLGEGPFGDYFVVVPGHDQMLQESIPWVSPDTMFSDFLASDSLDAKYGGENFLDGITAIM